MKLESPYLKRGARLELTSLLDVMFLVLVFFIYSIFTMAVHRGVKVDLPAAAGTLEKGERIVVTVDASERFQLNGRSLDRKALVADVRRLLAVRPDTPILIAGDRKASLGTGLALLADVKAAGARRVSFQVRGGDRP